jgi:hypothetical protein
LLASLANNFHDIVLKPWAAHGIAMQRSHSIAKVGGAKGAYYLLPSEDFEVIESRYELV